MTNPMPDLRTRAPPEEDGTKLWRTGNADVAARLRLEHQEPSEPRPDRHWPSGLLQRTLALGSAGSRGDVTRATSKSLRMASMPVA